MWYPRGRFSVPTLALVVTAYAPALCALELEWRAPAGCPTTETVKREVQRLAGSAEGASLVARAAVTQTTDQRWRVAIDLSGSAKGHRTLTADTCVQLARASALIIALAANPEASLDLSSDEPAGTQPASRPTPGIGEASSTPTPTPTPTPAPAPTSTTLPTAPSERPALTERSTALEVPTPEVVDTPADANEESPQPSTRKPKGPWALFAHTGLETGSLPTSTAWLGVGLRRQARQLPLATAISALVTQGTSARYDNGVGADFRFFAGQAMACLQPHVERWLLTTCFGAQAALTRAQAHFRSAQAVAPEVAGAEIFTRYRWSFAPAATLTLGYEFVSSLWLELGGSIAIPTTRWEFVVDGVGPLYRVRRAQLAAYAGLGISL